MRNAYREVRILTDVFPVAAAWVLPLLLKEFRRIFYKNLRNAFTFPYLSLILAQERKILKILRWDIRIFF